MLSGLSRQVLDILEEGVCVVDEVGRLIDMNPAAERLLGLPLARLRGQLVHRLIPLEALGVKLPGDLPTEIRAGHGDLFYTWQGGEFKAEWRIMPIPAQAGLRGALVVFQDISQRLDLEKAIREKQELIERSFNDPEIGKAIISPDGRFLRVNQFFCQLLGYKPSELLNHSFLDFAHPDDREVGLNLRRRMCAGQMEKATYQKRYLHRNGDVVLLTLSTSLVRDPAGAPQYFVTQVQDITPMLHMEAALRQSQERYRRAFEDAAIGMAIVSLDDNYMELNPQFCRMLGYRREELLAQPTWVYTHPEDYDVEAALVRRMMAGDLETCEYEKRYLHRLGHLVWAHVTASCVRDEAGNLLYFVRQVQDVTGRKQADAQLQKARMDAENAAAIKAEFLAMISHEVRTPMNAVMGMASLLEATPLEARQRELVETIQSSAGTLMAIMNDVLDFSKIESGKMELDLHPFALASCVEEVCAMFQVRAAEKGLNLSLHISEALPAIVLGDSKRLMQILINLIGNALKFTDDGSVTIRVLPDEMRAGNELPVQFIVSDTGCGIPENKLQVIFDSFTQAAPTTFRHYGGSGLGLSICHRLVQLMRGHIEVESTPGQGSTFRFTIPVTPLDDVPEMGQSVKKSRPAGFDASLGQRAPLRILIAEDNRVNQQLMLGFMEGLGYADRVTLVGNGQAVLDALESETFDLIFMDVQMPVLDGLETSRRINERYGSEKRPRIIAITAFGMQEDRQNCLDAGMDDYLSKPILMGQLEDLLEFWYQRLKAPDRPSTDRGTALPALAPLDTGALLARFSSQPDQLREMAQIFEEENALLMAGLLRALPENDTEAALRNLHQMKGGCLALCAERAKGLIAQLEARVKAGELQAIHSEVVQLQAALNHAQAELKQVLSLLG